MFASSLQAQTGDWQAVQNLKPGSRVIVKAQRGYLCSVEGATEDQLVWTGGPEARFFLFS